jgi:hypothetical protein
MYFLKGRHSSHDDYGKTVDDIEKRFFACNCQQKNLNRETFIFCGLPVHRISIMYAFSV